MSAKPKKTELQRLQAKAKRERHESKFAMLWKARKGPSITILIREYKFHPTRKWRFDFAHLETRVAIEVEGGTWSKKKNRHTTGKGYADDREKYNSAQELGWKVFSLTPEMITIKQVERIASVINSTIFIIDSSEWPTIRTAISETIKWCNKPEGEK